jgi:hypothetical protein
MTILDYLFPDGQSDAERKVVCLRLDAVGIRPDQVVEFERLEREAEGVKA